MAITQNANSINGLIAPPIQAAFGTTEQLMDSAVTPEQKKAAFLTLFYAGTEETLSKAVDYFFKDPVLFSQTVQDLSASVSHKDQLKIFLRKMTASEDKMDSFISGQFVAACSRAKTISEYKDELRPYFAFKQAFEGIDRNRKAAHSCPSACDLLNTFNRVNERLNLLYGSELYHQYGNLCVAQGPA
jgi:hypothetical protein